MVAARAAPYAEGVARPEACLIDAYQTIISCDFLPLRSELPALAGIAADTWQEHYNRIGAMLTDGRLSKTEGFGQILAACGLDARDGLVSELVRRDQELLLAHARLFDDVVPFLRRLRARGVKTAVVSNCTENTRPLLVALGIAELADDLVLSCEVRAAKPEPEIFRCALGRLGVAAEAAVFVDDQPGFCAGGAAVGIAAVQIIRGGPDGTAPDKTAPDGTMVVRSLSEVEPMFAG